MFTVRCVICVFSGVHGDPGGHHSHPNLYDRDGAALFVRLSARRVHSRVFVGRGDFRGA